MKNKRKCDLKTKIGTLKEKARWYDRNQSMRTMISPYFKVMDYISFDLCKKILSLNCKLNSVPTFIFYLYFSHLLLLLFNWNMYFLLKLFNKERFLVSTGHWECTLSHWYQWQWLDWPHLNTKRTWLIPSPPWVLMLLISAVDNCLRPIMQTDVQ